MIDDGLAGAGVSVILLGVTLLAGLVGVIFIGTVNMLILPTGSFLVIVGGLSTFSSLLSFSADGVDVGLFVILAVYAQTNSNKILIQNSYNQQQKF